MAKKMKKTAGPEPERKTVADRSTLRELGARIEELEAWRRRGAVERASRWARLYMELEAVLEDDLIEWHGSRAADCFGADDEKEQRRRQREQERKIASTLEYLARRLTTLGPGAYNRRDAEAIATLAVWFDPNRSPRMPGLPVLDPLSGPEELIGIAMHACSKLFDADLAVARSLAKTPRADDLDLLRRLRHGAKTAPTLAVEMHGGSKRTADTESVERAIERLRAEYDFELPNDRGAGYSLSRLDRERLDQYAPVDQ